MDRTTGQPIRTRAGFTLLELVLVLMLVGLLAAVVMPRLHDPGAKVRATERSLMLLMLSAQQRAVLQQHRVNVLFDTAGSLVVVHEDRDGDGVRESGEPERVYVLEAGVRFTRGGVPSGPPGDSVISFPDRVGGLAALSFGRSGAARSAGGLYLGTTGSEQGRRPEDARVLLVERATGQVTRYYLDGGEWKRSGRN